MKNKTRLIRVIIITLLLLLAASSVSADFSQRDWYYVKDIILPSGMQPETLIELAPDNEVYAEAASGLTDLRIISSENEEIPYKLEISQAEHELTSFAVSLRDKGYVRGSYNTFTADLGRSGILHNEIEFQTPNNEFRRKAIVETSSDGFSWMKLAEQTVYAFTVKERGFTTRDTRISYPESTARYLRVTIEDDGEGSLEISGATVFLVKETPAREMSRESAILQTSHDDNQNTTSVEIDLGSPGIPSHRLAISVPDVNFYREATVQASPDRENWSTLIRRVDIYSFDTPKFTGNSLVIDYPETNSRYLRLVIYDEDSPPLTVQKVNAWSLWRRLVFIAEPHLAYQLYYGNANSRRPSYDIEKIFPYLETEILPEAKLGPQASNPEFEEEKPPVSERYPWLFPTVITVAAVIVALILIVIFRQVRKALPPPEE